VPMRRDTLIPGALDRARWENDAAHYRVERKEMAVNESQQEPRGPFRQTPTDPQVPSAATPAAATPTVGGGVTFDFVFNSVTYSVQVFAPDPQTGQFGFTITQATTTIASLIYKDTEDWKIEVGLPGNFQVDSSLTINALTVDIQHGTVTPLS
jgi:hypothetical protein